MPSFAEQEGLLELNKESFDFTLQFEQLFFSIIPSVLFIVFSIWRSLSQARKPTVVDAPVFQLIKLVSLAPQRSSVAMLTETQDVHYSICWS